MLIGLVVMAVLIVLIGVAAAVNTLLINPDSPTFAVGSCVKRSGSGAEQVDCTTAGAFRVMSRVQKREDCADLAPTRRRRGPRR